jgi:hypothetical protein
MMGEFWNMATITDGSFSQTFTITNADTYTLLAGTTRTQTANTAVQATVAAGSTTIDIQGTLNNTASGQRALRANLGGGGEILIGANGLVQSLDGDAIQVQSTNPTVNITNLGQIISQWSETTITVGGPAPAGAAFAINLNAPIGAAGAPSTDFTSGGVITNGSAVNNTALIQSNSGDAIRMGAHQTLVNWGTIDGNGPINDAATNNFLNPDPNHQSVTQKYDVSRGVRINAATATNDTIENHGRIEGAQHAIDVGNVNATNIVVKNFAGATIIGHNGSGVGADTVGVAATTVVVENFGTILGEYAPQFDRAGYVTVDGDGDGVDVDGGATIINHTGALIAGSGLNGVLNGQGAGGFDSAGRTNRSEGISIGGGSVTNDGTISGASFGIIVNNDSNPDNSRSGVLATTVTNGATGTIIGQSGFAIRFENKTGTAADNDTIENFGTITGNGSIPDPNSTVLRQDGNADPGVNGTLDGVTYTSGADAGNARFISGDGSAIQTGEGNDILSNHGSIVGNSGRAINMEGGTDTLNLFAGQSITGRIDGGAGTDTVTLQGNGTGVLANIINFEALSVQGGGTWTIADTESYANGVTVATGVLLVNGSLGSSAVAVNNGGTLGGQGTVGAVTVANGGTLSAGTGVAAAMLSTGNLALAAGAHFRAELGGAAAGQSDQVHVTGTVDLNGAALDASLINGFNPHAAPGTDFSIIDNDLGDAVTGMFAGLAEGAIFNIDGNAFQISYHGGDGNDVVLTAYNPPGNNAPTVSLPSGSSVHPGAGQSLQLSSLFSGGDVDGDTLTYLVYDASSAANSGHVVIGGNTVAAQTITAMTAAEFAQATFVAGAAGAIDHIYVEAYDGTAYSGWNTRVDVTVAGGANNAPTVSLPSGSTATPAAGQSLQLSSLFSGTDLDGDTLTYYVYDASSAANSGHVVIGGNTVAAQTITAMTAAELAQATFVAGAAGSIDYIYVQAYDGTAYSGWNDRVQLAVPGGANHAPTVSLPSGNSVNPAAGQSVQLSSLFSGNDVDGDTLTYYVYDNNSTANSGHVVIGGNTVAALTITAMTAAELAQATFVAGAANWADDIFVQAYDGTAYSGWNTGVHLFV